MNRDEKMSDKDVGDKVFEFRPIFPVFGQKSYDPKQSYMGTQMKRLDKEILFNGA